MSRRFQRPPPEHLTSALLRDALRRLARSEAPQEELQPYRNEDYRRHMMPIAAKLRLESENQVRGITDHGIPAPTPEIIQANVNRRQRQAEEEHGIRIMGWSRGVSTTNAPVTTNAVGQPLSFGAVAEDVRQRLERMMFEHIQNGPRIVYTRPSETEQILEPPAPPAAPEPPRPARRIRMT